MMETIIKGGTLITASASYQADIGIEGGKIVQIGRDLQGSTNVYDATGKWVTPGAVDIHVHMELDLGDAGSSDTFYTGTRAALFGGTTSVVDFIEAGADESLRDAFLTTQGASGMPK
ncbi:MAG UNVERIFIED_CONTAM: amidohydrolase family protein [Anaerolineae bacterium]|jgi:dihydropyrimidinase